MPRHLEEALDALASAPAPEAGGAPWAATPAGRTTYEYFQGASLWYELGVPIAPALRKRAVALATSREDARVAIELLLHFYPCREFRRAFRRHATRESSGDFTAWIAAFPDLTPELRDSLIARAGRFQRPFIAISAALVWARSFAGGDEAWRQIARVINYDDRRQRRRARPSDFLRHDLETHGTITDPEGAEINRFLLPLGAEPLHTMGNAMWWQSPAPDAWRHPAARGRLIAGATLSSFAFAARRWDERDEALYAELLAASPAVGRGGFLERLEQLRAQGRGESPRAAMLRRVAARAGLTAPP
ncbi:MAG: hypothetical protein H6713_23780 [Myxococcales bacterium]|nr:hypothetical protein [Myxococcales bacterium]